MPKWDPRLIAERFQDAAFDPTLWPDRLHELSKMVGGVGAVLVSNDHRLPGAPVSDAIAPMINDYYREGWNKRDIRFRGLDIALSRGVTVDQDFISQEEMNKSPYYNDWLAKYKCRYFASIGLQVNDAIWCISIQRSIKQGLFEQDEVHRLRHFVGPVRDAALLTHAFGKQFVLGMAQALELTTQAAILLNESGKVVSLNETASKLSGIVLDVRSHSLTFRDPQSAENVAGLLRESMNENSADGHRVGETWIRDEIGPGKKGSGHRASKLGQIHLYRGVSDATCRDTLASLDRLVKDEIRFSTNSN